MKPIRLTFAAETKVLSAGERTCEFVASDQTVDSYGEIVRAAGWKFDRFAKNAPFVDSHNYSSVACLLGNVSAWRIAGDKLIEAVKFVPEGASQLADFAWKMAVAGFLRAVSVGFMPLRVRSRWRDQADFTEAVKEMKLSGEVSAKLNCIHWEQDQTELSSVLIGANPSAVALAHKSGAVADADLASIGFRSDDDISFLHDSANGWNAADATLRKRIRAELRGIMSPTLGATTLAQSAPPLSTNSQSTAPAKTRDAAAETDALARKALLAELTRTEASAAKAAQATGGNSKR
jgi:hypothetical protein